MTAVLDLDPRCLIEPARLDLAAIEATMFWPTDPEARALWWRAAALEEGLPHIDGMPLDTLRQYAKDAMSIPRISELNRLHSKRHIHGVLLGTVTFEATYFARHSPQRAALYRVQDDLCERLRGTFQIQPQTMKNKDGPLSPMKPAAHLWAAYIHSAAQGDDTFPCRKVDIGKFLATAEAIRLAAEHRRAPKAKSTVMQAGESVILTADIASRLPSVTIDI